MKPEQNGIINDKLFKYGFIISLFLIGIGIYKLILPNIAANVSPNYSNSKAAATATVILKEKPEFQEIQIPDQGLSKLIEIPPGRCSWINSPGWLEYYFLTEKGYASNFKVANGEQRWDKKISPSPRFKLKGQPGIAKIWLQPCPQNSQPKKIARQKNQLCDSNLNDYSENSTTCSVPIQ